MRYFTTIILILLISGYRALASNNDSLENLLNSGLVVSVEKKIEVLNHLMKNNLTVSPEKAIEYGKEILQLAEQSGDDRKIALAFKNLGSAYFSYGDFLPALELFKKALQINIKINDPDQLAASYNNIGVVYNRLGSYELALKNHLSQLKINEENNNKKGIAISNNNIGNIYNNMDENDKALTYYRKSMEISEELGDKNSVANALINLGVVSTELKNYDEAISYFSKALDIKEQTNDLNNIAVIYLNLGTIYRILNRHNKAIEYFASALKIYESLENKHGKVISLISLGDINRKLKNYGTSFDYLQKALKLAKEVDAKKSMQEGYKFLSEWYQNQGDFDNALKYFKIQAALKDTLFDIEEGKQIKNLQIVYEVEKKEKEILEQNISIQKLKNYQLFLGFVIIVVLTIAALAYYRYYLKKKVNLELEAKIAEALKKQREQQQIIVHQASLTSLGELASGIAHEIKQPLQNILLSAESLEIENNEPVPDKKYIEKTLKEVYEDIKRIKFIINEISNFSRKQQEPLNETFNVNTRIRNAFSLARTKFSNLRISVRFELDENIPDILGNPYKFEQVIVNFFNNAKDAIVEKASKSDEFFEKEMIVKSFEVEKNIIIEVTDNGIGIPQDIKTNIFLPFYTTKKLGKGTGLGLSISLGIIKEMNGFIELDSEKMSGTTMRIKIPVA